MTAHVADATGVADAADAADAAQTAGVAGATEFALLVQNERRKRRAIRTSDPPASQAALETVSLDLAKDLQCPICLETFTPPVARLKGCMHYFCKACIGECHSARQKGGRDACPSCKAVYTRRDIIEDPYMSGLIDKFMKFEEVKDCLRAAVKVLSVRKGSGRGAGAEGVEEIEGFDEEDVLAKQRVENMMLPWVQGIDDDAYASPTQSFSALVGGREEASEGGGGEDGAQAESPERAREEKLGGTTHEHVVLPSESEGSEGVFWEKKGDDDHHDGVGDILEGLEDAVEEDQTKTEGGEVKMFVSSVDEGKENAGVNEALMEEDGNVKKRNEKKEANKGLKKEEGGKGAAGKKKKKAVSSSKKKKATTNITPAPPMLIDSTPMSGDVDTGARRRVPARLQPWTCGACTFENKGAASDCEICGTVKGADAVAGQVAEEQKSIAKNAKKAGSRVGGSTSRKRKGASVEEERIEEQVVEKKPEEGKKKGFRKSASASATVGATEGQEDLAATPPGKKVKLSARERRLLNSSEKRDKILHESVVCAKVNKANKVNKVKRTTKAEANEKKGTNDTPIAANCTSFLAGVVATSSNLSADDKQLLECTVPKFKSTLAEDVTHVICPSSKDPVFTPKYLTALLKGIHIVSMDWLMACVERVEHVDERDFSLKPDSWKRGNEQKKILADYEVHVAIPPLSKEQNLAATNKALARVETLLQAAGAKIVQRLPRKIEGRHCLVLVIDSTLRDGNEASQVVQETWYARARGADIPVVKQSWLKESILRGSALDDYDDYQI